MFQRSSLRYAHTTGHTQLIYTKDGSFMITCGADGDIRKWTGIDDDDPTSTCLGEFIVCIAQSGNRLLASTDRNTLQAYTFPDMDKDGTLMRFTAPVTCICVTEGYTAAGSEDTVIKLLRNREGATDRQLDGHIGPVLGVDISESKGVLASIAGDGKLKIWNLESGAELKTIHGLATTNSFESTTCFGTPKFEPRQNDFLAYVKGKQIHVLNTSTWEEQFVLTDEHVKGEYTCCEFSNDGKYLAAGSREGEISIFDFQSKKPMKCEPPSSDCQAIISLAWNPSNNLELAYCDATGQLGTIFSNDAGIKKAGNAFSDMEAEEVDFDGLEFEKDDDLESNNLAEGDDINGDDDDDGVSIEKLKKQIMKSSDAYTNGNGSVDEDSRDSIVKSTHSTVPPFVPVKTFRRQGPFQPGSTPKHLEHRFLVWNSVGIVSSHADSADGSVDVEFHDVSVHHSLHIANYNNYDMASLSSSVLALSSHGATKMVCISLAASGNKEWTVEFPDCESVEALAATSKLIGVVTNMHFLRLFTLMGTQREIISIPGSVVAMAGYEDRLIVCYHSAPSDENQQNLAAMLIQTSGLALRSQNITFPLPPGRQLTWLGFSDCGSPVFGDHMGLVQLFSVKSNTWYPICDTMKQCQSVSNTFFIVAVSERNQIIQAVFCRGISYPVTNPRPMVQELPMKMPMCNEESEKSELEDALVRATFMSVDNADKVTKETAIKLFALACRSEIEPRAKELIETIACPDLLTLAVKYASKLGRIHLSDRLYAMMPQVEEHKQNAHQELQQLETYQRIPNIHYMPVSGTPTGSGPKLAPKVLEISASKRSALKRFSLANSTPTGFKRAGSPSTPNLLGTQSSIESQENLCDTNSEPQSNSDSLKSDTQDTNEPKRTPLNFVNPFAAKRKLADADKNILMGTERLKFAKK